MALNADVTRTIGRTPLVKLNKVTAEVDAEIYLKCEFFNPLASVKDRIGVSMIEAAESAPAVMSIALHPYLVGQPYRLRALKRALHHILQRREAIWLTRPGEIAEAYAARLLLERTAAVIDARIAGNQDPHPTWNAQVTRDTAYVAQLATRATQRVFEASGGSALQDSEPIQRIWRDVHAGHAHAYLDWDVAAEGWSNAILQD